MLRTIIVSTLRQTRRHPLYMGLNIFGLALGLCAFLLLGQFVQYEHTYDRSLPDASLVARVDVTVTLPGRPSVEMGLLSFYALPFLRSDLTTLAAATLDRPTSIMFQIGSRRVTQAIEEVDHDYLKTIPLKLQQGDARTALDRPDAIVLSARTAQMLFGAGPAMGQTIVADELGDKTTVTVTGILAPPAGPVSIDPAALMIVPAVVRAENEPFLKWASTGGAVYVRFRNKVDMQAANAQLHDFMARRGDPVALGAHPERRYHLSFVPLTEMHFRDSHVDDGTAGVNRVVIDSIGLVAVLGLVLAVVNAINLSTARGVLRAREVAIRKTLGAPRLHLLVQFIGESLLLTTIAGIVALALREVLLPTVAAITATTLANAYGSTLAVLACSILVTGIVAGIYPAIVLSGYRPAAVLAASRMPAGGRHAARVRTVLVLGQFMLAVTIVICTSIIHRQVEFIRNSDLGYEKQGILIGPHVYGDDLSQRRRVLDALRVTPGVQAATLSVLEPSVELNNNADVQQPGGRSIYALTDVVGDQYQEVYRPHLVAGRWFDAGHGQDESPGGASLGKASGPLNVVINQRAVRALGFANPESAVGRPILAGPTRLNIIGVEQDIRFVEPRWSVAALVVLHSTTTRGFQVVTVRYAGVTRQTMQDRLRKVWDGLMPDVAGDFQTADDRTSGFYDADQRQNYLFLAGSIVGVAIACLGLWGLASFAGARRRQEVGIRKTLGATTGKVVSLMLREFLTPVLIACAIACPLAWAAMRTWLATFAQRITLSPLDFLFVIAGAVLIAIVTVTGQTLHVARAEPARALQAE